MKMYVCALTPTTSPVTNSEAVHHPSSFSHICEMSRIPYHDSLIGTQNILQRSLLACSLPPRRTLRRPFDVRIVDQTSRMSFRTSKPQMSEISQLPHDQEFEEERYPNYKGHQYYHVQLGQTFASRYRVIAKLGYGTASTVWLSLHLVQGRSKIVTASSGNSIRQNTLVTLKVCILGEDESNELAISHHIKSFDDGIHPGKHRSRVALDDFHIRGPHGTHHCLVFPALGRTLAQVRNVFEDRRFDKLWAYVLGLGPLGRDSAPYTTCDEASSDGRKPPKLHTTPRKSYHYYLEAPQRSLGRISKAL